MPKKRAHYTYFIIEHGEIVYVGQSVSPKTRWRVHQKRMGEHVDCLVAGIFDCFEDAACDELYMLTHFDFKYNDYIASSPSRLGKKTTWRVDPSIWSPNRSEMAKRGWETRDRSPEANAFYGKKHTAATIKKVRAATKAQFSDPVKRERHRKGVIEGIRRAQTAGIRCGRKPYKNT